MEEPLRVKVDWSDLDSFRYYDNHPYWKSVSMDSEGVAYEYVPKTK